MANDPETTIAHHQARIKQLEIDLNFYRGAVARTEGKIRNREAEIAKLLPPPPPTTE